jgi:tetratricopeptide (TPR) repeat protein
MSYIAARRFDPAIQDYTQAFKLKPNDPEALKLRAIAYHKKGQYDLAIQDCNLVIKSNPKDGAAFIVRGSAKKKKGDIRGGDADLARGQLLRGTTPVEVNK